MPLVNPTAEQERIEREGLFFRMNELNRNNKRQAEPEKFLEQHIGIRNKARIAAAKAEWQSRNSERKEG